MRPDELVQDGDTNWGPDLCEILMELLGEALVTGHDEGVGLTLRAMALAVRNEAATAVIFLRAQRQDLDAHQAWLYGYTAAVVKQARDLAPEVAEYVLDRWKEQKLYRERKGG